MSKIRRVCLYAGPGAGKSVIAAKVFADLKVLSYNVEPINEYIKTWAYQKRVPKDFDQLYIFGKQIHHESRVLPHVDFVVTDSPILMNIAYAKKYNCSYANECLKIGLQFEEKYPGLHVFLNRNGLKYNEEGRYENYGQALDMDMYIRDLLIENNIKHCYIRTTDYDEIIEYIKDSINGEH